MKTRQAKSWELLGPPASWWRHGWGLRVCFHHLPLGTSAQPSGHPKDCCWATWQYLKKHYCVVQFGDDTGDAAMKSWFASEGLETTGIKTGQADCGGSTALEERKAWERGVRPKAEERKGLGALCLGHGVGVWGRRQAVTLWVTMRIWERS